MHRSTSIVVAALCAWLMIGAAHAVQGDPCSIVAQCSTSSGSPCRANTPQCSFILGGICNYPLLSAGATCLTGDGVACTTDTCDAAGVCQHTASNAYCSANASDGNVCTLEVCNSPGNASGCSSVASLANGNVCTDNNACTSGDICQGGTCSATPITCNDNVVCTNDSCNPATGCVYAADNVFCQLSHHDDNECSAEICTGAPGTAATEGCEHSIAVANNTPCDDGNLCTDVDRCQNGACVSGPPVTCDDGMACTAATCNELIGCQTNYDDAACDDHNPCTIDDCDGLAGDGCRHINRPDDAFVGLDETCGAPNLCGDITGEITCQNGVPVSSCPSYVSPIVALGDHQCSTREVAYAIVVDVTTSEPVGTVRCWRDVSTHEVACDKAHPEDPQSTEAKVYAGLYCPAD